MPVKGRLWLDAGAQKAVCDRTQSLLAAGLLRASGDFLAQDAVVLCSQEGTELARGLVNYSREEVEKIKVPKIWGAGVALCTACCRAMSGDHQQVCSRVHVEVVVDACFCLTPWSALWAALQWPASFSKFSRSLRKSQRQVQAPFACASAPHVHAWGHHGTDMLCTTMLPAAWCTLAAMT